MGMVTPVGLTASSSAAAIRAGITRTRETSIHDRRLFPIVGGFLDEVHLPPLVLSSSSVMGMTRRHERLLRLASPALQEAARGLPSPLPLLLALPEPPRDRPDPVGKAFLDHLSIQSGVALDIHHSQVLRLGRAGGLMALEPAVRLLSQRRFPCVLVGGVDSYLDFHLLSTLEGEERLLTRGALDGFIPGEAAAFLLLAHRGAGAHLGSRPLARIEGLGLGMEPGHLYSQEPYRGEGLAEAFHALFSALPLGTSEVRCVYSSFNGEGFWAREWGVARLRHTGRFASDERLEHPAECVGDPGAASGPLSLGLAALGIHKQYRDAPCLVWCSSDREPRAAALVTAARA